MKTFHRVLFVVLAIVSTLSLALPTTAFAATSPTLGTADSFAILSATNITNVPLSVITGDVGLSPATGAGIGLTAAQVTGTIYAVDGAGPAGSVNNPGLLTTAQADNTAAFLALSAAPNVACTQDYGAVTQDLVGLSLVPGVYCANAFSLSGTLTLNDTGAADGVWIFRSELSTLITSAGSVAKVVFLNGIGSSCNVWWKVASSATLNTGTEFIGNILALTSISMKTGATLNGRVLAQTGAVTLEQNAITNAACYTSAVATVATVATIDSSKGYHATVKPKVSVTPSASVSPVPQLPNTGATPQGKSTPWSAIILIGITMVLVSIYRYHILKTH